MRALDAALNATWAMDEKALETLLDIAARQNDATPEAIEAYRAKSLANTDRARSRDGVAILDVIGATFKRANLFTAMSGATSYDMLRADFQAALDDPKVKSILLNIDSPGGEASGVHELAQAVFEARGSKPIVAYVGGLGASAGYWLASAADKIVVDATAALGSIGVQVAYRADSPKAGQKEITFTSSQSPMKNADPETEAGAKAVQDRIDAMASVFYEAVARNRGVDTETALKNFGKGGIFVGKDAVKAGLADELGSFEGVLAELAGARKTAAKSGRDTRNKGISMSETAAETANEPKVDVSALVAEKVAEALAANNARIVALNKIAAAHGVASDKLNAAIAGGTSVADFALEAADAVVAAKAADAAKAAERTEAAVAALKTDGDKTAEVTPSTGVEKTEDDEIEALAKATAGHIKKS